MYKAKISMMVKFKTQLKSAFFSFWGRVLLCVAVQKPLFKLYANSVNKDIMKNPDAPYIIIASVIGLIFLCAGFALIARESVDEAICYTDGEGFPWVRVALRTFLPGEALYLFFTVIPWGDLVFCIFTFLPYNFARFGNYTSAVLDYLYRVSYAVPESRVQAVFGSRFYEMGDLAAFLQIYAVYEAVCVLAFIAVFAAVYKIKHSRQSVYESKFENY